MNPAAFGTQLQSVFSSYADVIQKKSMVEAINTIKINHAMMRELYLSDVSIQGSLST